jgi:3-oxoisoapionate decarboxylase
MDVVEALAPRAFTTHFKDMGVERYEDGFLLSEVPLGTGFLDLERIVKTLRRARPEIVFNIEMITRDPLKVPCLTDRYWATFGDLPGRHLARALRLVRDHPPARPLPRISTLDAQRQLRAEDDNINRCLSFARDRLAL